MVNNNAKKRIILLVLVSLFLVAAQLAGNTYAWFSDTKDKRIVMESGKIKYALTGKLWSDDDGNNIIIPDQVLSDETGEGGMTIENLSSIDTNLRMMIAYSEKRPGEDEFDEYKSVKGFADELFEVNAPEGIWIYNEDGYFYCQINGGMFPALLPEEEAVTSAQLTPETVIPAQSTFIPTSVPTPLITGPVKVIDRIKLRKEVESEYSQVTIRLKIIFQAKQKNIAEWSDIGDIDAASIDFSQGEEVDG